MTAISSITPPDASPDEAPADTAPEGVPDNSPDGVSDNSRDELPITSPDEVPDTSPDELPGTSPGAISGTSPNEVPTDTSPSGVPADASPDEVPDTTADDPHDPLDDLPDGVIHDILRVYNGFTEEECTKFNKWLYILYASESGNLQILTSTKPHPVPDEPLEPVQFLARLIDIQKGETVLTVEWYGGHLLEQEAAEGDPRIGIRAVTRKLFEVVKGMVDVKEGRATNGCR